MWQTLSTGQIKEFAVDPAAKTHHTTTPHMDAVLPMEEREQIASTATRRDYVREQARHRVQPRCAQARARHPLPPATGRNPEDEM